MKRQKKKSNIKYYLAVGLGLIVCYFIFIEVQARFFTYKKFGVRLPKQHEVLGIDVSKYQGNISWNAVKKMEIDGSKIDFAFIKATQGLRTVDLKYYQNIIKARANDLPVGSYHFFLTYRDAEDQAKLFLKIASIKKGDLPPVVDIEEAKGVSAENIRKGLKKWLKTVEKEVGIKPIIYTSAGFYNTYLAEDFSDYPLWVANYNDSDKPKVDAEWVIWQFAEKAHINGIRGNVDLNVLNGDLSDLQELIIK
jgi:lysozyme